MSFSATRRGVVFDQAARGITTRAFSDNTKGEEVFGGGEEPL